jgi:hypothetical protein
MRRLGLTPEQRALILSLFRTPTKLGQPRKTRHGSIARSIFAVREPRHKQHTFPAESRRPKAQRIISEASAVLTATHTMHIAGDSRNG